MSHCKDTAANYFIKLHTEATTASEQNFLLNLIVQSGGQSAVKYLIKLHEKASSPQIRLSLLKQIAQASNHHPHDHDS